MRIEGCTAAGAHSLPCMNVTAPGLLPPEGDIAPGSGDGSLSAGGAVDAELVIERGYAIGVSDPQRTIDIDLAGTSFRVGDGVDAHRRTDGVARQGRAAVDVV